MVKITEVELDPSHPIFNGEWRRSITAFYPKPKGPMKTPESEPELQSDKPKN
jgi:hypothetical protein